MDLWIFNLTDYNWTAVPGVSSDAPPRRFGHAVTAFGDRLFMGFGEMQLLGTQNENQNWLRLKSIL